MALIRKQSVVSSEFRKHHHNVWLAIFYKTKVQCWCKFQKMRFHFLAQHWNGLNVCIMIVVWNRTYCNHNVGRWLIIWMVAVVTWLKQVWRLAVYVVLTSADNYVVNLSKSHGVLYNCTVVFLVCLRCMLARSSATDATIHGMHSHSSWESLHIVGGAAVAQV